MFTKGEWKVERPYLTPQGIYNEHYTAIKRPADEKHNETTVCILEEPHYLMDMGDSEWYDGQVKVMKANANLIAAAPDMYKELEEAKSWLARFVMKFYIRAENPTYADMKALYQELDTFQRTLGEKALSKAREEL
ncbi:hypothetical protein LCGC14_0842480 [marine sediment metagenome]|uniref:Uncharacterized protein n=1 Tax=marine sediment metagenome TaxID=412755 RepID=A0A0F9PCM9_9ZZZZ